MSEWYLYTIICQVLAVCSLTMYYFIHHYATSSSTSARQSKYCKIYIVSPHTFYIDSPHFYDIIIYFILIKWVLYKIQRGVQRFSTTINPWWLTLSQFIVNLYSWPSHISGSPGSILLIVCNLQCQWAGVWPDHIRYPTIGCPAHALSWSTSVL